MSDLAYIDNGHGIGLSEYPDHFFMVFDLSSTHQASNDYIHPEHTDCSISIELMFSPALPSNIEIFIIGKKANTVFIDSAQINSKNQNSHKLMDEDEINNLAQACKILKYKLVGVFAADNFPVNLSHNNFLIVSVSISHSIGTHWTLNCRKNGD